MAKPSFPVRLDSNLVPILELDTEEAQQLVDDSKAAAAETNVEDREVLVGQVVQLHNARPITLDPDGARVLLEGLSDEVTTFSIGWETLDEAAKSVIGTYDHAHAGDPPEWVSSTHEGLATVLAAHYDCEIRPLTTEDEE